MSKEKQSQKKIDSQSNCNDDPDVLSQEEIDRLLDIMCDNKEIKTVKEKKIKVYDFKRPDIIGKAELRIFSEIMEKFCIQITDFLQREYKFKACVHVASVDQYTRQEFIFTIPSRTFAVSSDWLGGHVILNMNPNTFMNGFLRIPESPVHSKKANQKNKKEMNEPLFGIFEQKIFMNFFAGNFINEAYRAFNAKSDEELSPPVNLKFEDNSLFLPYTESPVEMGVIASLEINFENRKNCSFPVHLFFNSTVIDKLCERKIIFAKEKLKVIPLEKPLGNFVAELGRCHISDDFVFEKNQLLELDSDISEPISVFIDGKKCSYGEAVLVDDSRAVMLKKSEVSDDLQSSENFYNIRAVWGSAKVCENEISGFDEGSIIELSEKWDSPVYIYRCGNSEKLCALGKVYILDEHFAVKITQVI